MRNVKIGVRLICGFLLISCISLGMGLFNIDQFRNLNKNIDTIGNISLPLTSNLGIVYAETNNVRAIMRTLLDEKMDDNIRKRQSETLAKARAHYSQALAAIDKLTLSPETTAKINAAKKSMEDWRASNDMFFKHLEAGDFAKARDLAYNANRQLQSKVTEELQALMADQNTRSAQRVLTATQHADSAIQWSNILMIAGFLISILLGLLLTRGITKPLGRAVAVADGLAQGDLARRMGMKRKDEIGMLSRSLDSMADTLSQLNSNIVYTADRASSGFLRSTIDGSGFGGDYKGLIASINTWAQSMLLLIDKVPSPMMIRDKDRNMRFLNAAGSLGSIDINTLDGRKCEDHFKTEDCANGNCACDKAFSSRKEEESETVATPAGVTLDIKYKGIPFSEDAVFEFIIDQTAIMKIQRKMMAIASEAEQVAAHVASASEELAAQVEQASHGAQEQAHRVGETATAMEEMNATVLEVAKNASQAAETAGTARHKAEAGAGIVGQVVRGMADVQKNALELKKDMTTLGEQAQGIGQIMNVISDIADQTNLLALNAAIEAARAGEAGRGFAVVADEVRKLAEKTMTATKEVGDAIHGIQAGTQKNIASVEHTVERIDNATALATQSGESLGEIVSLVEVTTDQVRSIATAAEQQSATSEEINRSVDDINRISTETSTAMRQSAQAVSELANQSHVLSGLIEEMQSGAGQAGGQKGVPGRPPRRKALHA